MALKNGVYLQVHFSDDMKSLLEKFSREISVSQSRICEQILKIQLPIYVNDYLAKKILNKEDSKNG